MAGSFKLSRASNIFSTSRLIQAGAFQEYVRDRCKADSTFYLCDYMEDLDNYHFYYDFLWNKKSILYDHPCVSKGKLNCWEERDEEFSVLVDDIYSHKKYVKIFISDAVEASIRQLFSFSIPSYESFLNHPYPAQMAEKFLKADRRFITNCRQNTEQLAFPVQNAIQLVTVIASSLYILFIIVSRYRRLLNKKTLIFGLSVLFFLIGNAVFVGFFAGMAERFQARVIWLIPFLALVLTYQWSSNKK
jgi:hypothetical protein